MNPATELAPQLKQLRLSGILDSLDARKFSITARTGSLPAHCAPASGQRRS